MSGDLSSVFHNIDSFIFSYAFSNRGFQMNIEERLKQLDKIKTNLKKRTPAFLISPNDVEKITEALCIALNGLGKISQLESMPLNDSGVVLKKHNVMGLFASEAITDIEEVLK
jgi:hypothetical protein